MKSPTLTALFLLAKTLYASVLLPPGFSDVDKRSAGLLEVIQVETPPRTSFANPSCSQVLFEHEFANSDGVPYVGVCYEFQIKYIEKHITALAKAN